MSLKQGDKGYQVEILQKFLKDKGFYSGKIDGDYGPLTKKAVWNYQISRKILIDGWAGKQTLGVMQLEGLDFSPKGSAPNNNQLEKFTKLVIKNANNFVGLVEKKSNAEWDDPNIAGWQREKSDTLNKYMKRVSGWSPGAPYCIAFANAIIVMSLEELGISSDQFLGFASAHVMTQVNRCKSKGILSSEPSEGSIWMARSGTTSSGHAGIVNQFKTLTITTVEGNTSAGSTASAKDQREGDGIWVRNFSKTGRGNLKTQGFLSLKNILDYLV